MLSKQWTPKLHSFKLSHAGSWDALKWIWEGRSFFDFFIFVVFPYSFQNISTNLTWGPGVTVNEKLFKEVFLIRIFTMKRKKIYTHIIHANTRQTLHILWWSWWEPVEPPRRHWLGPYYETWPDACLPSDERVSREQGLGTDLRATTLTTFPQTCWPHPVVAVAQSQDRS